MSTDDDEGDRLNYRFQAGSDYVYHPSVNWNYKNPVMCFSRYNCMKDKVWLGVDAVRIAFCDDNNQERELLLDLITRYETKQVIAGQNEV